MHFCIFYLFISGVIAFPICFLSKIFFSWQALKTSSQSTFSDGSRLPAPSTQMAGPRLCHHHLRGALTVNRYLAVQLPVNGSIIKIAKSIELDSFTCHRGSLLGRRGVKGPGFMRPPHHAAGSKRPVPSYVPHCFWLGLMPALFIANAAVFIRTERIRWLMMDCCKEDDGARVYGKNEEKY